VDDFDLPDFVPAFFLVAAADFLDPDCFPALLVEVDFFFVVFLVAIVSPVFCSFLSTNSYSYSVAIRFFRDTWPLLPLLLY
jgi:hypothetical protein